MASEEKFSCKSDTIYEATESGEESELHNSEDDDLSNDESKNISVERENILNDSDEQYDANSIAEKSEDKAFYYEETKTGIYFSYCSFKYIKSF